MGVQANYIYLTSSHMSQAGLMLGVRATGAPLRVVGVCPSHHQPDKLRSGADTQLLKDAAQVVV